MEASTKAQRELANIERQIETLEAAAGDNKDARARLKRLHDQVSQLRQQVYAHLTAWQKTELARHPQRPYTQDYIDRIFSDWSEIHGDRSFGDDPAIICGMARFQGSEVIVIGHQKGRDTKSKVYRNFGMPNPEEIRQADLHIHRHARRLPRIGRRGARTSRSHRPQPARNGALARSDYQHHHGRGWQRRSIGHCRR